MKNIATMSDKDRNDEIVRLYAERFVREGKPDDSQGKRRYQYNNPAQFVALEKLELDNIDYALDDWASFMKRPEPTEKCSGAADIYHLADSDRCRSIDACVNSLPTPAREAIELRHGLRKHGRISVSNPAWSKMTDGDKELYAKVWRVRLDSASAKDCGISVLPSIDYEQAKVMIEPFLKKRGIV